MRATGVSLDNPRPNRRRARRSIRTRWRSPTRLARVPRSRGPSVRLSADPRCAVVRRPLACGRRNGVLNAGAGAGKRPTPRPPYPNDRGIRRPRTISWRSRSLRSKRRRGQPLLVEIRFRAVESRSTGAYRRRAGRLDAVSRQGKVQHLPSRRNGQPGRGSPRRRKRSHDSARRRRRPPLFTDFTAANLGVPRNPALRFYCENTPSSTGYTANPAGAAYVDRGVGRSSDQGQSQQRVDAHGRQWTARCACRPCEMSTCGRARIS